ncbi:thiolase-like protein [Neolentinus lepideus HHB14362 ss-1]|uniref:Thiolase-like protein n=1 Tax=Neolentinus lepideus HHB14362 ss-1 TaxID=1314782 RepID=A0A165S5D4_9AGAM|nr:thiolase-like protein [Neolentinus lepideus HHB14362 ss-1]
MSARGRRSFIVGVGCTAFIKPRGLRTTNEMGLEAATKALLDAGITYDAVEAAFVGYCYGDSTSGQSALYPLGMTGIPITNVNNNCSTGSTALYQANNLVKGGLVECALALGFEKMAPGSLGSVWKDREQAIILFEQRTQELELEDDLGLGQDGPNFGPAAPRMFANAGQEYFNRNGANMDHLASIAAKNHKHAINNPYAQFRNGWTREQVLAAPKITKQLTKLMCSPTSDGAACCIVASEDFVHAHGLENQAIEIVGQQLTTDTPSAFDTRSAMDVVGFTMTRLCADRAFAQAGFDVGEGRDEVGVIELHDCFSANELITYDALRLCPPGEAHKLVERGDNTYGGKWVVNPSGGLEAKGHPLGATGLGMHFYITMQLRNWAGPMQVSGLFDVPDKRGKFGLVHNIGIGGAVVVSLLRRPEFYRESGQDGKQRLGYNHAYQCKPITKRDVEKVKARQTSAYVWEHAKL